MKDLFGHEAAPPKIRRRRRHIMYREGPVTDGGTVKFKCYSCGHLMFVKLGILERYYRIFGQGNPPCPKCHPRRTREIQAPSRGA